MEGDTLDLEDSKTGPRQVLLSSEARVDHRAATAVGQFLGVSLTK